MCRFRSAQHVGPESQGSRPYARCTNLGSGTLDVTAKEIRHRAPPESADGRTVAQGRVGSLAVVVVEPAREPTAALFRSEIADRPTRAAGYGESARLNRHGFTGGSQVPWLCRRRNGGLPAMPVEEAEMARRGYPPELRRRVVDLVEAGLSRWDENRFQESCASHVCSDSLRARGTGIFPMSLRRRTDLEIF